MGSYSISVAGRRLHSAPIGGHGLERLHRTCQRSDHGKRSRRDEPFHAVCSRNTFPKGHTIVRSEPHQSSGKLALVGSAVIYLAMLGSQLPFTPVTYKTLTIFTQQALNITPIPSNSSVENHLRPYDAFVANYNGFCEVLNAINDFHIKPQDLDLNKNGILLDSSEEIENLISIFKGIQGSQEDFTQVDLKKVIRTLEEITIVNKVIWGENGPLANNVSQNGIPNCQWSSFFKGMHLTPDLIQKLKRSLRIVDVDFSNKKNRFNFLISVNGEEVKLSSEEVNASLQHKKRSQTSSTGGGLYVAAYRMACERTCPDRTPNLVPSSSSILLTGEQYTPLFLFSLSDKEIDYIFAQAPQTPITVASHFKFKDILAGMKYREINWDENEGETTSEAETEAATKKTTVREDTAEDTANSETNTPNKNTSSFPFGGTTSQPGNNNISGPESMINGHIYALENCDEDSIYITDAHGCRIKLSKDEIRKNLIAVIAPNKLLNTFGDRGLPISGLILVLAGGMFIVERRYGYGIGGLTKKAS